MLNVLKRFLPKKAPRALPVIDDPDANALKGQEMYDSFAAMSRSLMHKQKVKCTGESDGFQCKHFWALTTIVSSGAADHLLDGERTKMCTYHKGDEPLVFGDGKVDMAVQCNRYERDESAPYVAESTEYAPLTPVEIDLIQKGVITEREQLFERRRQIAAGELVETPAPPKEEEQTVSISDVLRQGAEEKPT